MSSADILKVLRSDIYAEENSKRHKAGQYDLTKSKKPTAVLRRGLNFYINILFDRFYQADRDRIRVIFKFGKEHSSADGSHQTLILEDPNQKFPENADKWGIRLDAEFPDRSITLEIRIPASALVGQWQYEVRTNIGKDYQHTDIFLVPDVFFIIFNPWALEDGVYLENDEERKEYILNDSGKVWCGTYNNPRGKHWLFGQFDAVTLPTAVFLLDKSGLKTGQRGSPVLVARAISAIVNANDDRGLLRQRWNGKYTKGTTPHLWTGSTPILDQYYKSGGNPVNYAQCWVYSAVVVTICRALGIPCRSITNYVSSPDPITISFDLLGELVLKSPDSPEATDFCWSFHAWNEVWMSRPDLPSGYGGWQVIDATPIQQSEGIMRLGPASVVAVKEGEVGFSYDIPFVFSEVNANTVHYKTLDDGNVDLVRTSMSKYQAGKNIVTRKLGDIDDRWDSDVMDITSLYKHEEGSLRRQNVLKRATSFAPQSLERYYKESVPQDLVFDLEDIDTVPFGDTFSALLKIRNTGIQPRTIKAALLVHSVFYTGKVAHKIKTRNFEGHSLKIRPGGNMTLKINVDQSEYGNKLLDNGLIKIHAYAYVEETQEVWSEEDDFAFDPPELVIRAPEYCKNGDVVDVEFGFQNPLKIPLTDCAYMVEGPTVEKPILVKIADIKPNERVYITETYTVGKVGLRRIVVNMTSNEIQGINGTVTINVSEN